MKEVDIISKVVGRDTSGKTAMYIPGAGAPSVDLDGYLLKKIWDSVFEIRTDGEGQPYLFEKMPFVTQYGITMYADGGDLNLPSIYAGLPIDNQTLYWENGVLKAKGGTEGAITSITSTMIVDALGYIPANGSDVTALQNKVNDFLSGSDTDTIINKWKELEAFLSGLNESDNLATILSDKADKATTLAGYGITDAYTKTKVDEMLGNYVTLASSQTITGEKNFTGGLKVNGSPIVYDATNKYWKLEGDLLVTGGVTMFASDSAFTPSTIMDAIATDGTNLKVVNGVLTFVGSIDGGEAGSVAWENVTGKPSFASVATSGKYSDLSGTPTLLSSFTNDVGFITSYVDTKNTAGSTNTSSKIFLIGATSQAANPQTYSHDTAYVGTDGYLYSGGAKVLTAHQTIYNLTLQAGTFSAATFDPNGANKTVNIPTTTNHITEGDNLYYTNARAQAAITGGASTIVTSNLTTNRALISNASGKVAVSAVTSTELGYLDGVTSAIQTQLDSKLATTSYTAADVLAKLLTVDGASSGLDADLLDGTHKSGLLTAASSSSATNLSITVGGTTKKITDLYAYKTTQLETARTIWGQSFDGTGNVSGALSGATTGAFSSNVTIGGTLGVTGDTTLATKLTLNGIPIYKSQDDVLYIDGNLAVRGGITMYATDAIDVPSIIDSLPTASTSAKGLASFDPNFFSVDDNGNVSFIGSTGITEVNWTDIVGRPTLLSSFINDQGFASTLGELSNVGSWADLAPTQGRLLYQEAGSSVWSYKNVSEFIPETGAYLPLSGGTLNGNLSLGGNKMNNVQTLQFASGVRGAANSGCSILGAFDAPYSATIQLGGYGTTPPSNATASYYSFKIVDNAWTSELFMVNNDGKNVFGCKSAINDNIRVRGINLAGQLKFPSTTPTIPHPMIFGNGSYLTIGYGNVTNYGIVIASGEVRPNATDLFNLGLRSYRWKSIHTIDAFLGGYAQFDDMTGEGGMNTGAARIGTFDHTEGGFVIQLGKSATADNTSSGKQKFEVINPAWNKALLALDRAGNLRVTGGITMYSDFRKKTKLKDVELTLQQIADAPLIEHYYNSDAMRTTHVGSIAQYWASMNDWFCKLDNEGYYTMEIQNAALASAISIARELVKYESKTDRKIRLLKQRVKELEDKIEKLENN